MKKVVLALVFVFTYAYAQVDTPEKTAIPASQEDVRKLQNELKLMRKRSLESEKAFANLSTAERLKMLQENKAAISATEKKLADKMESNGREARNRSENQIRTQRTFWSITLGAVLLSGVVLGWLLIHKNRALPKVVIVSTKDKNDEISDILIDPNKPTIRETLSKKQQQRFVFSIKDGTQIDCVAELKDGEPFVTKMNGQKVFIAWDKRRTSAEKLIARSTTVA